jgi:hypothetical protein
MAEGGTRQGYVGMHDQAWPFGAQAVTCEWSVGETNHMLTQRCPHHPRLHIVEVARSCWCHAAFQRVYQRRQRVFAVNTRELSFI